VLTAVCEAILDRLIRDAVNVREQVAQADFARPRSGRQRRVGRKLGQSRIQLQHAARLEARERERGHRFGGGSDIERGIGGSSFARLQVGQPKPARMDAFAGIHAHAEPSRQTQREHAFDGGIDFARERKLAILSSPALRGTSSPADGARDCGACTQPRQYPSSVHDGGG
jgi:hypothetical protein